MIHCVRAEFMDAIIIDIHEKELDFRFRFCTPPFRGDRRERSRNHVRRTRAKTDVFRDLLVQRRMPHRVSVNVVEKIDVSHNGNTAGCHLFD